MRPHRLARLLFLMLAVVLLQCLFSFAATAQQALPGTRGGGNTPFGDDGEDSEPYQLVRFLQELQTRTAQGGVRALRQQRDLIREMDIKFSELPPQTWTDPRNARALVVYTLSGGHPRVARSILAENSNIATPRPLLEGALAYIENRTQDAIVLLSSVDPATLPPAVGAQLSLVLASLIQSQRPAQALKYLNSARLLMPGTLIEDASLRRMIYVTSQLNEFPLFQATALRYLRHFGRSLFIGDFRRRLALALRQFKFANDPALFAMLDEILVLMDPDIRLGIYLLLSRDALIRGEIDFARHAALGAVEFAVPGSGDAASARLYYAGSLLSADMLDEAFQTFWSVDVEALDGLDRNLRTAIADRLNAIRAWPVSEIDDNEFGIVAPPELPPDPQWGMTLLGRGRAEVRRANEAFDRALAPG